MPHPAPTSRLGSLTVKSLVNKETGYFLPEAVGLVGRDWSGPWVPWKQSDFSIRQTGRSSVSVGKSMFPHL